MLTQGWVAGANHGVPSVLPPGLDGARSEQTSSVGGPRPCRSQKMGQGLGAPQTPTRMLCSESRGCLDGHRAQRKVVESAHRRAVGELRAHDERVAGQRRAKPFPPGTDRSLHPGPGQPPQRSS